MYFVSSHADWWVTTLVYQDSPPEIRGVKWATKTACKGNYKFQYSSNIKNLNYRINPEDHRLGGSLSMTGGALNALRARSMDTLQLISLMSQWNIKNTPRLDLCLNGFGFGKVTRFIELVNQGKFVSLAQPSKLEQDWKTGTKDRGWTARIGSYDSEQFVNIYDKAAEQKVLPFPWIRAEIRLKNDHATRAIDVLLTHGVHRGIQGLIKKFVDFPTSPTWRKLTSAENIDIPPIDPKQEDWVKWLTTQVLPSINSKLEQGIYYDEIQDFINKIRV